MTVAPPNMEFCTTKWTMVRQADNVSDAGQRALASLLESYWHPCAAFLTKQGVTQHDAEDTVQSFFAWLIEKEIVSRADANRGRFRTFLLTALIQFCGHQRKYQHAQKRKPSRPILSLTDDEAYVRDSDNSSADVFAYRWAIGLVHNALNQLQHECEERGRGDLFRALRGFLFGDSDVTTKNVSEEFAMTDVAVRAYLHRLRNKLATIIRAEVAQTVNSESEIDDELIELRQSLQLGMRGDGLPQ